MYIAKPIDHKHLYCVQTTLTYYFKILNIFLLLQREMPFSTFEQLSQIHIFSA